MRSCIILSMPTTVSRSAEITISLPREQAMALFTPEGERRWPEGVRYARVMHGVTAGTIAVDALELDERATRVRVSDLTALTPGAKPGSSPSRPITT